MEHSLRKIASVPVFLAAVTLAVFWPTLSARFVYDAVLQIQTGDFIHDPGNWLPVLSLRVLGMDVLDFNRPAHLASLMLDAAVWGREPFGYHLTSVLTDETRRTALGNAARARAGAFTWSATARDILTELAVDADKRR